VRPGHVALAALTSVVWGVAFVASKLALESFSPAQLTAARFILACLPVVVVPRPGLAWPSIVLIGLTLFTGQFLLLFVALAHGLPPGVASVTQQLQAFFTVLLAAVFLADVPTRRQGTGMAVAFFGLALVGLTADDDLSLAGLWLGLGSAFSWAIGNVLIKRAAGVATLPLVVWCSLVPPLPALIVSAAYDPPGGLVQAAVAASWRSLGGLVYLAVLATVVAYAAWGFLLQRYSTAVVAPFALLAPCAGAVASAAVFGEVPSATRLSGMALILLGFAVVVVPVARRGHSRR
jgi:O-acetylserine/cysteine efflux transporter